VIYNNSRETVTRATSWVKRGVPTRAVLHKVAFGVVVAAGSAGCSIDLNGDGDFPSADGTFTSSECKAAKPALPRGNEGIWQRVLLDDVVDGEEKFTCGNGEPYKFFVQYNTGATDLTISLEPGGACWDYATCKGQAGVLNPVRLNGVRDDFMTYFDQSGTDKEARPWAAMYPHLGRIDNSVPTNKYNHVFFPYCTGDAFTGRVEKTYANANGETTTVRHHGRRNLEAAVGWLKATFRTDRTDIGQLLVVGSSAGAVGATTNYPLLRDAVAPKCGAMVSDAGPIFPPKGGQQGGLYPPYAVTKQQGLLDKVSEAWALKASGGIVEQLDNRFGNNWYRLVRDNFGHVNRGLARAFPNDRFLFTTFKEDLNFSVFSFVGGGSIKPTQANLAAELIKTWKLEVEDFRKWIDNDSAQNWGYYLPNFRPDFCSHMVATSPLSLVHDRHGVLPGDRYGYAWDGIEGHANGYYRTEVGNVNLGSAIRQLLDRSQPIPRVNAGNEPTKLSFTSAPGVGVAAANDWYNLETGAFITDKQAYINAELQRCVFTNGYPK
jgi:hypothetical protein